jgi:hypothetical protein
MLHNVECRVRLAPERGSGCCQCPSFMLHVVRRKHYASRGRQLFTYKLRNMALLALLPRRLTFSF